MERLLVTGVDGTLGCNLALALADEWQVLGCYSDYVIGSSVMRTTACEPCDVHRLGEVIRDWQPAWIVHCGPLAAAAWDAAPHAARTQHEPAVVATLSRLASALSARLTVISSDAVFLGPRMFHDETSTSFDDAPRASEVLAMERALDATAALVVRTHAYGWSPVESQACFAELMAADSLTARPADADGRRHATPMLATDLARYLAQAYRLRLEGLYHVAGAERTSPYRFTCELASSFGMRHALADAQPSTDSHSSPQETSLSSGKARRALEMTMPMLREGLARFALQRDNGWRKQCWCAGPLATALEVAA